MIPSREFWDSIKIKMEIQPYKPLKEYLAPVSKSHLQRELLLSCCANEPSILVGNFSHIPQDPLHALEVVEALGGKINRSNTHWKIFPPSNKQKLKRIELNVGESGFLLRTLLSVGFLFAEELILHASGTLLTRNLATLQTDLKTLAIQRLSPEGIWPLVLRKKYEWPQHLIIDASGTSQVGSGILMAIAAGTPTKKLTLMNLVSKPYLYLTLACLKHRGVEFEEWDDGIHFLKVGLEGQTVEIQGDWSGAANLLVMGAISGKVTVNGLTLNSLQADEAILKVLTDFGALVAWDNNRVSVRKSEQRAFEFDATHAPDLVPLLCVLAANAKETSRISGIHRLATKESDRLIASIAMLDALGVSYKQEGDALFITGGLHYQGQTIQSFSDHRIILAALAASTVIKDPIQLSSHSEIEKSFVGLDFY